MFQICPNTHEQPSRERDRERLKSHKNDNTNAPINLCSSRARYLTSSWLVLSPLRAHISVEWDQRTDTWPPCRRKSRREDSTEGKDRLQPNRHLQTQKPPPANTETTTCKHRISLFLIAPSPTPVPLIQSCSYASHSIRGCPCRVWVGLGRSPYFIKSLCSQVLASISISVKCCYCCWN